MRTLISIQGSAGVSPAVFGVPPKTSSQRLSGETPDRATGTVALPNPTAQSGLTILEMLVSTAMLSFIVLGLTAMLIQTQKAFKTGIKENTITDSGSTIMNLVSTEMSQMADAQNTNAVYLSFQGTYPTHFQLYNMYWGTPNLTNVVNYIDGTPVRTNILTDIFFLAHTNNNWIGIGYSVSNYTSIGVGALYRYETNWTSLSPIFTNDLFSMFYNNLYTNFNTNYWHKVADGVIDFELRAYDAYGNTNYPAFPDYLNARYDEFSYPVLSNYINGIAYPTYTNLPCAVELQLGLLEPDALIQARSLAGNPLALSNFLSSNSLPKMEVFRQRITIAAASR